MNPQRDPEVVLGAGAVVPRVSIIMAVHNGARHIGQAIRSLQTQRFDDLEVIVVDDGSSDATREIVGRMADSDARIRLIARPASGRPAFPRNDGLEVARGEYVGFLDHDDFSYSERVGTMVQALDANSDWIAAFHDIDMVDEKGCRLERTLLQVSGFREKAREHLIAVGPRRFDCGTRFDRFASLYTAGMHTQSVMIARRRLDFSLVRFDPQFAICDDTDLWIRLSLTGRIGFVDEIHGGYRQHPGSLMTRRLDLLEDAVRLHEYNFERVAGRFDAATLAEYRRRVGGHHAALAWYHYDAGRLRQARAPLRAALRWWNSPEYRRMLRRTYLPQWVMRTLRGLLRRT
ncbi:MAG: glycosyltransferase [Burkholderiales bacterium]|nr:glycosyltransferase [Burkholderiales bacterium]